mmetsp:Transcript_45642/g.130265  ORF Transcript_45642/g.130265 Transcript_45642/m.130265 type:complete len:299 (-) Transcript_45642:69-965(-)
MLDKCPHQRLLPVLRELCPAIKANSNPILVLICVGDHMHFPAVFQEEAFVGDCVRVLRVLRTHHLLLATTLERQRQAMLQGILVCELSSGTLASTLAAAFLGIRDAGDQLIHREVLGGVVDLGVRPHHRLGGVGPAAAALALVPWLPDCSQVHPADTLRQVGDAARSYADGGLQEGALARAGKPSGTRPGSSTRALVAPKTRQLRLGPVGVRVDPGYPPDVQLAVLHLGGSSVQLKEALAEHVLAGSRRVRAPVEPHELGEVHGLHVALGALGDDALWQPPGPSLNGAASHQRGGNGK